MLDKEDIDLNQKRGYQDDKNMRVLDAIRCLDANEASEILRKMRSHYAEYKKVEIDIQSDVKGYEDIEQFDNIIKINRKI